MKHLKFFFIISLLLLVTGLGCKGLSEQEKNAIRPVTLTYWTVFDNVDQLREFAKQYKQIRPYVTIDIQRVRYDEFENRFVNALADDVAPDIVSIQNTSLQKYSPRLMPMPASVQVANITIKGKYSQETVVTLENNPMPNPRWIRSQLAGVVGDDVIINDRVIGLPLAVDTLALYYNKDLLDRSGVPVAPQTWTDFFDAVKQSTSFDEDGNILQSGVALGTGRTVDNAFDILSMLMLQNGVRMSVGNQVLFSEGLQQAVDNHPTLQALRFYTDFAEPTKEVYSWNNELGDALSSFVRGKSVFFLGFAYDKDRIRAQAPQMNLEVIPIPQLNPGQPTNIANYWVQTVVRKTQNPNEAWDFIRFITNEENIKTYVGTTGQVSPYRSQIAEQQQDELLGPFANQALFAKNWYTGRNIDVTRRAFEDMIEQYLVPFSGQNRAKRDAEIVINAARIVQQTM